MSTHKNIVRFTFDCPIELHTIAKMKASANHQSMEDYFIGLLAKDAVENPPEFMNDKTFKKELKKIFHEDSDLMKKLTDQ